MCSFVLHSRSAVHDDQSYAEAFEINPVGDFDGDLHEFQITDNNTALLTIYHTIPADLTSIGGPLSGWIYDCIFQEVDIATGELIFEWRASLHYPINSTLEELKGRGKTQASAFDFFHLNSVQKDSRGDYLISARHTHTVSTINHVTGEVLWNLGGTLNEFTDLSHGAATDFSWQMMRAGTMTPSSPSSTTPQIRTKTPLLRVER